MSDFTPYQPIVPARVSKIIISISSEKVEDHDPITNEPLGTYSEVESIHAEAVVVEDNGSVIETHMTENPQVLINNGILTGQQLLTLQTWIQSVRENTEAALLPPP